MKKVKVGYFSLVKGSWINDRLAGQRTDALADAPQMSAGI